ncbi:MAG TPA: CAP domain-containing protein [Flavobacteriaceae bacterium]|jgi:uncharacterized protein YkwD|nr:CAP domain-containing protein [Flavobacteriaceae bacterium]HBS11634.1 CAP domain-containing protein [Flavobacteriaceae bacterium]
MKSTFLKYSIVLFVLFSVASCSEDDSNEMNETAQSGITNEIFVLVNEHRESLGLPQLVRNTTADNLAVEHTKYMVFKNGASHDNFNKRANSLRTKENAKGISENVAYGFPTAKSVVYTWLKSKGHRVNIEGNYTKTGIAAIKNSNGKYYFTQLFYK